MHGAEPYRTTFPPPPQSDINRFQTVQYGGVNDVIKTVVLPVNNWNFLTPSERKNILHLFTKILKRRYIFRQNSATFRGASVNKARKISAHKVSFFFSRGVFLSVRAQFLVAIFSIYLCPDVFIYLFIYFKTQSQSDRFTWKTNSFRVTFRNYHGRQ